MLVYVCVRGDVHTARLDSQFILKKILGIGSGTLYGQPGGDGLVWIGWPL